MQIWHIIMLLLALVGAYFVAMKYVLPRFGGAKSGG